MDTVIHLHSTSCLPMSISPRVLPVLRGGIMARQVTMSFLFSYGSRLTQNNAKSPVFQRNTRPGRHALERRSFRSPSLLATSNAAPKVLAPVSGEISVTTSLPFSRNLTQDVVGTSEHVESPLYNPAHSTSFESPRYSCQPLLYEPHDYLPCGSSAVIPA